MYREKMFGIVLLGVVALATFGRSMPGPQVDDDAEKLMHPHVKRTGDVFPVNPEEIDIEFWRRDAQETLAKKKNTVLNTNVAKNVIMFLGDGMSIGTIKSARVYLGQLNGEDGERTRLAMENFPFSGLSKTYCLDALVADSACSATAYLCGVKANDGTIGVGGRVALGDCQSNLDESNFVYSIAKWSQDAGKRTGVVTTTRVTHASPSGVYAHIADRDWESDYDTPDAACPDIAVQLVHGETGKNLNVAMGGGRRNFIPNTITDEEGVQGRRRDDRNLIEEWLYTKEDVNAEYVWNRTGLLEAADRSDYILGLFEDNHMKYYLEAKDNPAEPTLSEMTEAAIKVLSKEEKGYFLFVEGGRIDHAHHDTLPQKSLAETVQFSEAIQRARDLTDEEDTLIVVTADHAHVFTVAGYPVRGTNILALAGTARDGLPYPILSYANGPGHRPDENGLRYDFSQHDFSDITLEYPATAPLNSETHSGEEVGIFASGPWAHLFTGVLEQNVIPHAMAFASCVGDGLTACDDE